MSIFLLQKSLVLVEYPELIVMLDHVNHTEEQLVDIEFHWWPLLLLLLWLLWSVYLNDEVDYEEEIEHMVGEIHRLNNEIE